jgi:hypothetical protein
MACQDCAVKLPMQPQPWWHVFVGSESDQDVSTVCNVILSLADETNNEQNQIAMLTFVPSCLEGDGSFNDPDSFLWSISD